MPKQSSVKQEVRSFIRANPNQERILSQAATARQMNVSQFVHRASLGGVEQILAEENRIVLSAEESEWLIKMIDETTPATPKLRLREALQQKPVWDV